MAELPKSMGPLVISRVNGYNRKEIRKKRGVQGMGYFYGFLWIAVGLILLFSMTKESRIFYFAGGFFLFLGAWWVADSMMPAVNLFEGGWGLALRCITGAALVVLAVQFVREYKRKKQEAEEQKNKKP